MPLITMVPLLTEAGSSPPTVPEPELFTTVVPASNPV